MFNHRPKFVGLILRTVGKLRFGFPYSELSASAGKSEEKADTQMNTGRLISPLYNIREGFAKQRLILLLTACSADNIELVLQDVLGIDSANDREDLVLAVEGFSTTFDGDR